MLTVTLHTGQCFALKFKYEPSGGEIREVSLSSFVLYLMHACHYGVSVGLQM